MRERLLYGKLLGYFLLVVLASLSLLVGYLFRVQQRFLEEETQAHLESLGRLVEQEVRDAWAAPDRAALQALVVARGHAAGIRVTLMLPDGEVIADSDGNPAGMENHRVRPEMAEALAGRVGTARRHSVSVRRDMMYVAQPAQVESRLVGVVRTSVAIKGLREILHKLHTRVIEAAVLLVLLAAAASYFLSRQISRPIEHMTEVAEQFARGRLDARVQASDTRELAALGHSMNRMAENLDAEHRTIARLLQEQQAIFFGMTEGLLVVDREERVLELNQAAAAMLGVEIERSRGRGMLEVVRNAQLQRLVGDVLQGNASVEGDLILHGPGGERFLQVRGASLRVGGEEARGALMVLTDVTRLKKLENIRREFVANASHELKTPVTAIKGFAETLAAEDHDATQTQRFSKIIARQADQLVALVEDLLELTRLEHEGERGPLERENVEVARVIWAAVEWCAEEARQKDIKLTVRCPEGLTASLNAALLQRALVNLLDNAIKYSAPHTEVDVEALADEREARVVVRDQGCGIPAEHLARIFERFYRVDKSRSRKLGGTGLGLSIVKHVAQAHGGSVTVESVPGRGSAFTLHLPAV